MTTSLLKNMSSLKCVLSDTFCKHLIRIPTCEFYYVEYDVYFQLFEPRHQANRPINYVRFAETKLTTDHLTFCKIKVQSFLIITSSNHFDNPAKKVIIMVQLVSTWKQQFHIIATFLFGTLQSGQTGDRW